MLTLGLQDGPQLPAAELVAQAGAMRASWTRVITVPGADLGPVRDRIRAAQEAGLRVVLTVGGTGTSDRQPGVRATLRWVARLPRADAYTWTNEPDLSGRSSAAYARGWRRLRRVLGRRLLWGDFSPFAPVTYTLRALQAARLPHHLDFAVHPYDFAPRMWQAEGALGHLRVAAATLRRHGFRVRWWLTEFGYPPSTAEPAQWARARRLVAQLDPAVTMVYTACGPTWCTAPSDAGWKALSGTA